MAIGVGKTAPTRLLMDMRLEYLGGWQFENTWEIGSLRIPGKWTVSVG
jgi:hypothetical protein